MALGRLRLKAYKERSRVEKRFVLVDSEPSKWEFLKGREPVGVSCEPLSRAPAPAVLPWVGPGISITPVRPVVEDTREKELDSRARAILILFAVIFGILMVGKGLMTARDFVVEHGISAGPLANSCAIPHAQIPIISAGPLTGAHYTCTLPDGQKIVTTFRGSAKWFSQLKDPAIGDMYLVDEGPGAYWIWAVPLGFKAPAWVDP